MGGRIQAADGGSPTASNERLAEAVQKGLQIKCGAAGKAVKCGSKPHERVRFV